MACIDVEQCEKLDDILTAINADSVIQAGIKADLDISQASLVSQETNMRNIEDGVALVLGFLAFFLFFFIMKFLYNFFKSIL